MKFRIIKYCGRYKAQAINEKDEYTDIGSPIGYYTIEDARNCCKAFKEKTMVEEIVEEFVL